MMYLLLIPLIYAAVVIQVLPISWGKEVLPLAALAPLAGFFRISRTTTPLLIFIGILDAVLSGLPLGFGLIWSGILGLIFIQHDQDSAKTFFLQLITAVLLRQLLWFSHEMYLNQLSMSLNLRLWQTAFSIIVPCWLVCTWYGFLHQIKLSFSNQSPQH